MKKVVYLENALKGLVEELHEKSKEKKQGDRLSISAYYGSNSKLFRQSEIDASICCLYKNTGIGLEQLPCGAIGSRIVFRVVGKEEFEKLFTVKESKPVRETKAETPKAETAETPKAETVKAETIPTTAETAQESKVEYKVSAFEQVKALIPSLTESEKQELLKLLKK